MVMKLVKVLCCMFLLFFGLDPAQNTIVVYSVLRNWPIETCWLRNACIVHERKTKDCAGSRTFQHKSWHLCLSFWCLPVTMIKQITIIQRVYDFSKIDLIEQDCYLFVCFWLRLLRAFLMDLSIIFFLPTWVSFESIIGNRFLSTAPL